MKKLPKRKKKSLKIIGNNFYDLISESLGYVKEFDSLKEIYKISHIMLTFNECNYYYSAFFLLIRESQKKYIFDDKFKRWCSDMLSSMYYMKIRYEIFFKSMPDFEPKILLNSCFGVDSLNE